METPVQTAAQTAENRIYRTLTMRTPKLILGDLAIQEVPDSIGDLTGLTDLDLESLHFEQRGSNLSTLPTSIGCLIKLRSIDVSGNQITWLPVSIRQLAALETFDLANNLLTRLPRSIGRLPNLRHLNVALNHLTDLPDSIGWLTKLEILDVSDNSLVTLPSSLRNLRSLKAIFLHGNAGLRIPPELLGPTAEDVKCCGEQPADPAAILDYCFKNQAS